MSDMPQDEKDLLIALSTPGSCKTVTDRPILFSAGMVRAILKCEKTQTRRIMKIQPSPDALVTVEHYHPIVFDRNGDMQPGKEIFGAHWDDGEQGLRCPYGAPGDTLWVRETWADLTETHGTRWEKRDPETGLYKRGVEPFVWHRADGEQPDIGDGKPMSEPWRPSIHMPRWASRITLRITDIRVERLQDITEDDARAEGCDSAAWEDEAGNGINSYRESFAFLWDQIKGPGAWDENPWVWAISFERVKP
jgi:hypothetical protein